MANTSEARALPFFTDLQGQPLSSGYIYVGQAGLDPIAYPINVYQDFSQTVLLAQPIRTMNGAAVSGGAMVHIFCSAPYSITVLDSAKRVVYTSLNEIDPALNSVSISSVQSASNFAELRARSGPATSQVWVNNFGMYQRIPSDTTSPENLPFIVVGNDATRYYLSNQSASLNFAYVNSAPGNETMPGTYYTWNVAPLGGGGTVITNNQGSGSGGFMFRNINADNTVQTGAVVITGSGGITSTDIISSASDVRAAGSVYAAGNLVSLTADGTRGLTWAPITGRYGLPSAPLDINGSEAVTKATLSAAILANQLAHGIGAVTVGTATMPSPGTWTLDSNISGVFLWVRTA